MEREQFEEVIADTRGKLLDAWGNNQMGGIMLDVIGSLFLGSALKTHPELQSHTSWTGVSQPVESKIRTCAEFAACADISADLLDMVAVARLTKLVAAKIHGALEKGPVLKGTVRLIATLERARWLQLSLCWLTLPGSEKE